ncbi:MAG: polysaccharide lyase family 8 super-sandwich domain-containing protein [Verrucomicrobiota bacterium]
MFRGKPLTFAIVSSALLLSLKASSQDAPPLPTLETVTQRYQHWILGDTKPDHSNPHVRSRYDVAKRFAKRATQKLETFDFEKNKEQLYDTRTRGDDSEEIDFLVKQALPALAIAYHLPTSNSDNEREQNPYFENKETLDLITRCFDRLHQRGFRSPMLMPWKAKEVTSEKLDKAVIVDFHLRTTGYALATFLMRQELEKSGRLEQCLATCREITSHGEKFGSPIDLKQNADGIRMAINFTLPYALAAQDLKALALVSLQVDRSMMVESNAEDTIKPDGLGFHHRGVYFSGYAAYGVAQSCFAAWLFRDTALECSEQTLANLSKSMGALRILSNPYEMHKSLAGRLKENAVIPAVIMGYAYLADTEHRQKEACGKMLARLANDSLWQSELNRKVFSPQRNEAPPGPGAISEFFRILDEANQLGAEPSPEGHWAFNYGPISVHRRDEWMVSVKGHSRYWWAFERSLVDARMSDRLENVLGFHDGSSSIQILHHGQEGNHKQAGWDWTKIPGTTTRIISAKDLLKIDRNIEKRINRPFGPSTFVGGLSLDGEHGLFAMSYQEVSPDTLETPLRATKAIAFFGDIVVVLTSKINGGDGVHSVGTHLYQAPLANPETPTWINGDKVTELSNTSYQDIPISTLVDPDGNGYYLPRSQNVIVKRENQSSLDESGSQTTEGNFATAWIDHGKNPDFESAHYVILPGAGVQKTQAFAKAANDTYSILQKNSRGIIIQHHPLGVTAYALPSKNQEIEQGLIAQADSACLVMTRQLEDGMIKFSVCNPDLGWREGQQYLFKGGVRTDIPTKPVPMPVQLTIRGDWALTGSPSNVEKIASQSPERTVLNIATSDAQSIEFTVRKLTQ